ncbi:MAG: GNAT family N-acetyltransferase [Candidatus Dormibacteria bacterium]
MATEFRPMRDDEAERVQSLRAQAFGGPPGGELSALSRQSISVLAVRDRVEGIIGLNPMGHFFGGRSVPGCGITSVAVAAESRGKGTGRQLMAGAFSAARSQGAAISALYPSSLRPYRAFGYELAGRWTEYSAPLAALPHDGAGEIEAWDDDDLDAVIACYSTVARGNMGMLDRPMNFWLSRVVDVPSDRALYRYCVRRGDAIAAYVVYTQDKAPGEIPYFHDIKCRDLIWTDREAALAILAFLRRDGALGRNLIWSGPLADPLTLLFAEQQIRTHASWGSMLRLLDVDAALEARGYPPALTAAVTLEVVDQVIAHNSRAFTLSVAGGRAAVDPATSSKARIDVGAFAAIYSGWLSAADAVRAGRLVGADPETVAALDLVFAGPKPWMVEFF